MKPVHGGIGGGCGWQSRSEIHEIIVNIVTSMASVAALLSMLDSRRYDGCKNYDEQ